MFLPLVLLAFLAWRHWQGPLLPGYRVEARPLVQRVVASGEVSSQSLARIGSELTGVIKARHVREGDAVKPGDLLLELDDAEQQAKLREAEAALRQLIESERPQANATLRESESLLARATRERERREALFDRQLLAAEVRDQARHSETVARAVRARARLNASALAEGGSAEQQLRQRLVQARTALDKTKLHAQVAGTVQTRKVEPGDLVRPGDTLLEIARSGSQEILLPLDEKNLAPLALGQAAQVVADAWPERVLAARVSYLAPAVDTARGTLDVHLDLTEPADFLRQGMTVSVNIETARRERALVIANDALQAVQGNRAEVLRVRDGRVERVAVKLGLRSTSLSEVVEGLAEGDQVLAGAASAGQRVRLALQALPAGVAE
ncbi:efflux RND transporter periplasmic adaptor subunit [Pseudomonas sp. MAP12]|uniref:Efflux RND transporter periplasmic adaptor subunit n=1 Tax=Geopseudomonas aromaticivorans TaxID=2849492 RepID=A0ABS6MYY3_9GAMM|nr:efflux RND transporter periplasmic adaptor subunit [Pseudomonas aromaticivorans]MBV2134017.1 efflux RND transporter periplasmic adaptor subunit [Pseudomonas aromaticivorans]